MRIRFMILLALCIPTADRLGAQELASASPTPLPKVRIPTSSGARISRSSLNNPRSSGRRSGRPGPRSLYPWKLAIGTTVFWIGERPGSNNPTPNNRSSWDQNWQQNFGGYDDPSPANRIADRRTGDFRPKAFVPKLNPFYVALPYNDMRGGKRRKPEAARVIPWFRRASPRPGETVLRGRWIQLHRNGLSCYAQWEDCGPWCTDDWQYVFGKSPPKNKKNGAAGIDISPAVRDYLGIQSGQKVHWRFVDASQVPYGPWKRYGNHGTATSGGPDIAAQRRYLEYLRKRRDEQYRRKSASELQQ
jgi:hypothetical protein